MMKILGSQEGPSSGQAGPWVSPCEEDKKSFIWGPLGELGGALRSPARDRMGEKSQGWHLPLAATAACLGWALAVTFLGLYLALMMSHPALQLQACRSELQNQTSLVEARFAASREQKDALEVALKQARGELQGLWSQQEATNASLAKTRRRWETCQEQLEHMGENITMQVNEATRREVEKCTAEKQNLLRESTAETQELKKAQRQVQAERDQCLAKNQQLEAQLKNPSGASSRVTTAFLLPGLSFLFLFLSSL